MKKTIVALFVFALAGAVRAVPFDGHQHDILDLAGGEKSVDEIVQQEWNGLKTVISNGTLNVRKRYHTRGGLTELGPKARLTIGPDADLATGAGDALTRTVRLSEKSVLRFDNVNWQMDHTRIFVPKDATWMADVRSLSLSGAQKNNLWEISGRAVLVRGINVKRDDWGNELTVCLKPGGELYLGGLVSTNAMKKGKLDVVLEGGRLGLFWDASIAPGIVRVAENARVEIDVAPGVQFDRKSISIPPSAQVRIVKVPDLKLDLPPRYPVMVSYDRTGRSYWLSAESSSGCVSEMRVQHPNPDIGSAVRYETAVTTDTVFRCRFPKGAGPWKVRVTFVGKKGGRNVTEVVVKRPQKTVTQPAPNDLVLVGQCGYGDALDLTRDVFEQDLCNLYVGWHTAAKLLPEKWPEENRTKWLELARKRKLWTMSIYAGDGKDIQEKLNRAYDGRYLGNNIGEYASFMYQGAENCPIPMDTDLDVAKDRFVNHYLARAAFGWQSHFPYVFSTCGAALSCYELQGGIDFICNEQWAIGAMNIAHTTAEARGAARKWGPEYWCAWNAHEWQTFGLPYRTQQKYDSCLAGFLTEYVMGTSMIVLESGAQGKQAWKYTADMSGQPASERKEEGYDGYVAKHYREVVKRFWDWVREHPRAPGTPETKIAMAIGNLDAYLGQNGEFSVFSQHKRTERDPKRWKYGAPEKTQALLEDMFFPRPADLLKPYGNYWIGGTPYGQVDVVQVDDDSTVADLSRYSLVAFGGWNTMTKHVKDVLERYVKSGGTLVMARPHLLARRDRDFIGYTDKDLMPLFDFLPQEGGDDAFCEKAYGKGRYVLFTGRKFPGDTKTGADMYRKLVASCAEKVPARVRLVDGPADRAVFAAYEKAVYILNVDTLEAHRFVLEIDGKRHIVDLAPVGIETIL